MKKNKENKNRRKNLVKIALLLLILLMVFYTHKSKINKNNIIAKYEYDIELNNQATINIDNLITSIPNKPVVNAGMIPIKWNGEKYVITTKEDTDWYNYSNSKFATMMLSDGYYKSELEANIDKDLQLASNHIGDEIETSELRINIHMDTKIDV